MISEEQRAELNTCVKGLHDGANITMDAGTIRSLLSALEEVETAYDTTYEVWQRTELENQRLKGELATTRKQLALQDAKLAAKEAQRHE